MRSARLVIVTAVTSLAALLVLVAVVASVRDLGPGPGDATGESDTARVVRWIDGDTVETSRGRVRLIGVDTPELGRCGAAEARSLAVALAPVGTRVTLTNPGQVQDTDRYGRLLVYVSRGSVDVGLRQVEAGAVARYDSLDGYERHPQQEQYRSTDSRSPSPCDPGDPGSLRDRKQPVVTTSDRDCPTDVPIKGNRGGDERIYHLPGDESYDATNPEECFATRAAAVATGYRAARS